MNPSAEKQIKALLGKTVGTWLLTYYIDSGKSAHVFKGQRGSEFAAVKVFDPELIEKYGKEEQVARIQRQLTLIGKHHPNLIEIIEGGICKATGHYYLVMDLFDGPSLAKVVSDLPTERVWPIVGQIASAARYLEALDIVHRDIKPDNIGITTDFQKAVLLDVGVMRPLVDADLTDAEQKRFIGTLRYSSPEFLFRYEEQNADGWRAITFYQLGAVLHDMLMRKPIFEEFTDPFARLVEAVRSEHPKIAAPSAPPDLVLLAQHCLLKDPKQRLKLIEWDDFQPKAATVPTAVTAKERIRKRLAANRSIEAKLEENLVLEYEARTTRRLVEEFHSAVERIIRQECIGSELFPPLELHNYVEEVPSQARLALSFRPSPAFGLSKRLTIWVLLELRDKASKIVAISTAKATGEVDPAWPSSAAPAQLYEGIFEEEIVRARLQDFLYGSLDQAQQ
jgi:eukaryotic-like serine/threonine-protein kinase